MRDWQWGHNSTDKHKKKNVDSGDENGNAFEKDDKSEGDNNVNLEIRVDLKIEALEKKRGF